MPVSVTLDMVHARKLAAVEGAVGAVCPNSPIHRPPQNHRNDAAHLLQSTHPMPLKPAVCGHRSPGQIRDMRMAKLGTRIASR